MATPLEIIVKGNVSEATTSLKTVQAELGKTALAAQKTDSSLKLAGTSGKAGFTELGAAIGKTESPLRKSLFSLSALANIIPGIGVAGLIAFAVGPIIAFAKELLKASESANAAKINLQNLNEVVKDANKEAGKQTASLKILYETATNVNVSLKDRLLAVKELQKEFPDFFKNISQENILNGDAKSAYDNLTLSILANARAKAAKAKIDELEAKRLDNEFQKQKILNATNAEAARVQDKILKGSFGGPDVTFTKQQQLGAIEVRKKAALELVKINDKSISDQEAFLTKFATLPSLAKVIEDADKTKDKTDKAGKTKTVKDVETIADVISKMREQIEVLNKQQIAFGTNEAQAKVKLLESTIVELFKKFKLDPENKVILQLGFEADDIKGREEIRKEIFKIVPEGVKIPIDFSPPKPSQLQSTIKEFFVPISEEVLKFQQLITDSLQDISVSALSGLGEAIGNALGGGKDPVKGLFNSLFSSVGQQLQQLGKFLIKSAIEIQVAKKAFAKLLANPVAAIAVGIGLVALGALIKQAARGEFPGFAGGVRNFRGGVALVGERGPELVTLPRGSNVIPNNQLSGGGLQTQVFIPEMRIAGQDLIVIFNRANQINSRNG